MSSKAGTFGLSVDSRQEASRLGQELKVRTQLIGPSVTKLTVTGQPARKPVERTHFRPRRLVELTSG